MLILRCLCLRWRSCRTRVFLSVWLQVLKYKLFGAISWFLLADWLAPAKLVSKQHFQFPRPVQQPVRRIAVKDRLSLKADKHRHQREVTAFHQRVEHAHLSKCLSVKSCFWFRFGSTRPQNTTQRSRRLLSTSAVWHRFPPSTISWLNSSKGQQSLIWSHSSVSINSGSHWCRIGQFSMLNQHHMGNYSSSFTGAFCWLVVSMFKSTSAEELRQQGAFVRVSLWKPRKPVRCLKGNGLCFTSLSLFIQSSPDWLVKDLNFLTCCEGGHFFF